MNILKRVFSILLIVVCFSSVANVAMGATIGVSPATFANDSLLPGMTYEQIIYVSRPDPFETMPAKVEIIAGDIKSWISIVNGNEFDLPKGIQQFPMKVKVSVPENANLGDYGGKISLTTVSPASYEANAPLRSQVGSVIDIKLKVIDKNVFSYKIQHIYIEDTPANLPIKLLVKVQNRGNVPAAPTKAKISFHDMYRTQKLWEGENDILGRVKPFSLQDVAVGFPNKLQEGQYWADVVLFDGDKLSHEESIVFTIVAPLPFWKNQNFLMIGAIIIGLILIVFVATAILALIKKIKKVGEE